MTFTTDNRYCVGSSGRTPPEDAVVAYGARWIDQGDLRQADILPDRQGLAYNGDGQPETGTLIAELVRVDADRRHCELNYDVTETLYDGTEDGFGLVMRRGGGYVYVDAWLVAS